MRGLHLKDNQSQGSSDDDIWLHVRVIQVHLARDYDIKFAFFILYQDKGACSVRGSEKCLLKDLKSSGEQTHWERWCR
jgi:hypothetical protein